MKTFVLVSVLMFPALGPSSSKWTVERYDLNGAVIETFTGCSNVRLEQNKCSFTAGDGKTVTFQSPNGFAVKHEPSYVAYWPTKRTGTCPTPYEYYRHR